MRRTLSIRNVNLTLIDLIFDCHCVNFISSDKIFFCVFYNWVNYFQFSLKNIFMTNGTYPSTISCRYSSFSRMSIFSITSTRRTPLWDGHFSLSRRVTALRSSIVFKIYSTKCQKKFRYFLSELVKAVCKNIESLRPYLEDYDHKGQKQ